MIMLPFTKTHRCNVRPMKSGSREKSTCFAGVISELSLSGEMLDF
jgi:hypothetical protein